ncbi:hypothetical protein NKDENANG_02027 [Candidatus Entotheonellaceae bacterium PAL068K]
MSIWVRQIPPGDGFSADDLRQMQAQGVTPEAIQEQVETFKHGIPFLQLHRPCTVDDGITVIAPHRFAELSATHAVATATGRSLKFVPASGAASRMFRLLLTFNQRYAQVDAHQLRTEAQQQEADYPNFLQCLRQFKAFAFYDDLRAVMARNGVELDRLYNQGQYKESLDYLLTPKGLNYANLPKALLKFHRYPDHCRTPLEEHLVEAAAYTRDAHGVARLHFTLTPAHLEAVQHYLARVRSRYESFGVQFDVTFSFQSGSTDTIAVDLQNRPFRDQHGQLVFRPAGHGALLANLHALDGDLVFIKNIDNIVPDRLKDHTYVYKRVLGGYLIEVQNQIFTYLRQLLGENVDEQTLAQMLAFVKRTLSVLPPSDFEQQPRRAQRDYLVSRLNRPLRVCGMVPNAGEPGGGPFWVRHSDGSQSVHIVETSQVDMQAPEQRRIVAAATHFNPVDLVCGVRDYQGRPFNLMLFSDPKTGFISRKSHQGRDLKALELPGLWNGAMTHWNTVFVEVPLSTFNPVKTVLDLLRPQHQP